MVTSTSTSSLAESKACFNKLIINYTHNEYATLKLSLLKAQGQGDIPQFKQAIIDIPVVCSLCLHRVPICIERNCDSLVTVKFSYSSVVVVTVYSFGIVISISVRECLMHSCFRRISRNHLIALQK